MDRLYSTEIIEKETSEGVPMLSFVVDKIYRGKRIYIRETFIHDRKNINYDRARRNIIEKEKEMTWNINARYEDGLY